MLYGSVLNNLLDCSLVGYVPWCSPACDRWLGSKGWFSFDVQQRRKEDTVTLHLCCWRQAWAEQEQGALFTMVAGAGSGHYYIYWMLLRWLSSGACWQIRQLFSTTHYFWKWAMMMPCDGCDALVLVIMNSCRCIYHLWRTLCGSQDRPRCPKVFAPSEQCLGHSKGSELFKRDPDSRTDLLVLHEAM